MNTFAPGEFKSHIPGIQSLNFARPIPEKGKNVDYLVVEVLFDKKMPRTSLKITRDGKLEGELLPGLDRDAVYEEILRIAETIGENFFEPVGDEILPADKRETQESATNGQGNERGKQEEIVDPKRIDFLRSQKNVLFGIRGLETGFRGYFGFVLNNKVVLESPTVGNAAYVFPLEKPIMDASKTGIITDTKERKKIIEEIWNPIARLTKRESLENGAFKVIHPPHNDAEWREKMSAVLAS